MPTVVARNYSTDPGRDPGDRRPRGAQELVRPLDRRARDRRVAGGASARRGACAARPSRIRIEAVVPDKTQPVVLYSQPPTARPSPRRRSRNWGTRPSTRSRAASPTGNATGSRSTMPRDAVARAAHPLLATSADPRDRRGRPTQAARLPHPPDRAGSLGSPAALYLAAAGIGRLGIIDADIVDETNLQRQIAALAGDARDAQGRLGQARDPGPEPGRRRRHAIASG